MSTYINTATVALKAYCFQQHFHQEVKSPSFGTRACKLCSIPQRCGGALVSSWLWTIPGPSPSPKASDLWCWLSCVRIVLRGSSEQEGWPQLHGVVVTSLPLIQEAQLSHVLLEERWKESNISECRMKSGSKNWHGAEFLNPCGSVFHCCAKMSEKLESSISSGPGVCRAGNAVCFSCHTSLCSWGGQGNKLDPSIGTVALFGMFFSCFRPFKQFF